MEEEGNSLWVFGYGSLVWKPGFQHGRTAIGYVEGYARRFWQGNETHRGIPGKPGRVATLVEEKGTITHGIAMELKGEEALDYLNNREMTLGGYLQRITNFHVESTEKTPSFPVLVFIATPQSKHWLGPAPAEEIAHQVVNSCGPSGHNVEYVLKLAQWLRSSLPSVWDEHLYSIESSILYEVKQQNLDLDLLMGDSGVEEYMESVSRVVADPGQRRPVGSYSAACQGKTLRCVKL